MAGIERPKEKRAKTAKRKMERCLVRLSKRSKLSHSLTRRRLKKKRKKKERVHFFSNLPKRKKAVVNEVRARTDIRKKSARKNII